MTTRNAPSTVSTAALRARLDEMQREARARSTRTIADAKARAAAVQARRSSSPDRLAQARAALRARMSSWTKPRLLSLPTLPARTTLPSLPKLPSLPSWSALREASSRKDARAGAQRLAIAALLVVLCALLARRACEEAPVVAALPVVEAPICPLAPECPTGVKKPAPKTRKRLPIVATVPPQGRAGLDVDARREPPWLADFRMQVMARSVELARCFDGADKPGALRWSTEVHPQTGAVVAHELEPLIGGPALSAPQERCVLAVLSQRPYRLPVPPRDDERDDARDGDPGKRAHADEGARVALVLEF